MEKGRATEAGWFPLQGSYEEAVLSWYEQIESSFRRREMEARRAEQEARRVQSGDSQPVRVSRK
jgi:hypothetical protein